MNRPAILVPLFALAAVLAVLPLARAQSAGEADLPVAVPSLPMMQDCEDIRAAYDRVAAALRKQAEADPASGAGDDAETVEARGRWLYDDCVRESLSGGGGMGG